MRAALAAWGTGGIVLPIMVILIWGFEIWYSRASKAKNWLS